MKRFLECLVPITSCNLRCDYCYIIYQNRRTFKQVDFQYSPERIGQSLSIKRLGGVSYISICGSGETLLPKEIVPIVYHILKQGHYVNITTNGTITKKHKEIINTIPSDLLKKLHFAFSFHYLELIRTKNLDIFFDNVRLMKNAGCSFTIQINLYDKYIPHWNEIKNIVRKNTGAFPQVALTRGSDKTIMTSKSLEEYVTIAREMKSPLFDFAFKNYNVKRKEFCYAGDWSGKLNLATGILTSCYGYGISQNIFENIEKPIKFEAIGRNCPFKYCFNSTHFMSLGVIPKLTTPTYADLRNRKEANWYNNEMYNFLSQKLNNDNFEYSSFKKLYVNVKYFLLIFLIKIKRRIKHLFIVII
jgi:organic radical activating enzyme